MNGYYCKHGTYIGHPNGPDYLCGLCENGEDLPDYDTRWSEGLDTREDENNLLKSELNSRSWYEIRWLNTSHSPAQWASHSSDGHSASDEFSTSQEALSEVFRLELLDDANDPVRRVVVRQTLTGDIVPDPRLVAEKLTARVTVDPATGLLTAESTCTIAGETVPVPFRHNNGWTVSVLRVRIAIRRLGYRSPRFLDTFVLSNDGYFEVEVEKI